MFFLRLYWSYYLVLKQPFFYEMVTIISDSKNVLPVMIYYIGNPFQYLN